MRKVLFIMLLGLCLLWVGGCVETQNEDGGTPGSIHGGGGGRF